METFVSQWMSKAKKEIRLQLTSSTEKNILILIVYFILKMLFYRSRNLESFGLVNGVNYPLKQKSLKQLV